MSVDVAPHRGEATTRALIAAALETSETFASVVVGDSEARLTVAERTLTIGFGSGDDYMARDVRTTADGTAFAFGESDVRLALVGERHVVAALAAIAVAIECGVPTATAVARVEGVENVEPGNLAPSSPGGILLLDDSYDASSRSTLEALKTVAEIAGESRRTIAVLGELATASVDPIDTRDEHDRIGRIVVRLNIGQLIVVGSGARHLSTAAGLEGSWDGESLLVETIDEAYAVLRAEIREGDVVLVKVPALAALLMKDLA